MVITYGDSSRKETIQDKRRRKVKKNRKVRR